jgi:hypothetical protein
MRNILTKFVLTATFALAITLTFSCSGDDGGGGDNPQDPSSSSNGIDKSSSSVIETPSSSSVGVSSSSEAETPSSSSETPSSSSQELLPSSSSEEVQIDPIKACIEEKLAEDSNVRHIWNNPLCEGATKEDVLTIIGDENGMFGDCVLVNLPNGSFNVIFSTMKINCNFR